MGEHKTPPPPPPPSPGSGSESGSRRDSWADGQALLMGGDNLHDVGDSMLSALYVEGRLGVGSLSADDLESKMQRLSVFKEKLKVAKSKLTIVMARHDKEMEIFDKIEGTSAPHGAIKEHKEKKEKLQTLKENNASHKEAIASQQAIIRELIGGLEETSASSHDVMTAFPLANMEEFAEQVATHEAVMACHAKIIAFHQATQKELQAKYAAEDAMLKELKENNAPHNEIFAFHQANFKALQEKDAVRDAMLARLHEELANAKQRDLECQLRHRVG